MDYGMTQEKFPGQNYNINCPRRVLAQRPKPEEAP